MTETLEDYLAIEDVLEIEPCADQFIALRCDRVDSFEEVEKKAGRTAHVLEARHGSDSQHDRPARGPRNQGD